MRQGETTPYPTLEAGADAMVQWTYYKGFFSSNIDFGLMAEPSGFDVTYTALWDDLRDAVTDLSGAESYDDGLTL